MKINKKKTFVHLESNNYIWIISYVKKNFLIEIYQSCKRKWNKLKTLKYKIKLLNSLIKRNPKNPFIKEPIKFCSADKNRLKKSNQQLPKIKNKFNKKRVKEYSNKKRKNILNLLKNNSTKEWNNCKEETWKDSKKYKRKN